MSLQEVLKKYESKKRQREKELQGLRNDLDKGIEQVSIKELKLQNHKVNHIHKNQQAIESRLRKQQELVNDLRKNQEVWASLYEQLNRALMQVGDLVHYAGYIEAQVGQILGVASVSKFLEEAENETQNSQQQQRKGEQLKQEPKKGSEAYEQIVQGQQKGKQ